MTKSQNLRGTLLTLLSGTLFGSLGYLGTQLVQHHYSIENMLFWRFLFASFWIGAWIVLSKREQFRHALDDDSLFKIFILGALSYSSSSVFYFISSRHIGTGLAMVLFYSFPVFVALLTWADGSWRLNRIAGTALLAVLAGLFLLKGNGDYAMDWQGISAGLVAALCYAAYVYGSRHTLRLDTSLLTFLVCLGNTLIFLFFSLYTSSFRFPTSGSEWFYICALGIIATAVPIQLLLDGLKYISPVKASVISVVEPVITVILGLVLLHESVSPLQSAGILILLTGALIIQFERTTEGI